MTDTISCLRAESHGIDEGILAHAALQYAEASILTLGGVATDRQIVDRAHQHDGMADLLGTGASILAAARSMLHGVSDGSSDEAVAAYRMIEDGDRMVGEVLIRTASYGLAVQLPGTLRDLATLDVDPLATVERAIGRGFGLKRYVELLEGKITIEQFLLRR